MPGPAVNVPLHEDFPIPAQRFVQTLIHTPDEVWARLLQLDHGNEKLRPAEWREKLAALKTRKA